MRLTRGAYNATVSIATSGDIGLAGETGIKLYTGAVNSEVERAAITADGALQMGGANTVITSARHPKLRPYTNATKPSAAGLNGERIWISDAEASYGAAYESNGAGWRMASIPALAVINTDADLTRNPITSASIVHHTGTLTADRTVTLSTTDAVGGMKMWFQRTGAGSFNLNIGGLKNLSTNTWCEVTYSGSAWILTAYGAL
jgi:hypothetical protein